MDPVWIFLFCTFFKTYKVAMVLCLKKHRDAKDRELKGF